MISQFFHSHLNVQYLDHKLHRKNKVTSHSIQGFHQPHLKNESA